MTGFEELSDELERLADRFERAAEDKKARSQDMVRARDVQTGQFVSFKEAIMQGITEAVGNTAIPRAEGEAFRYLPDTSNRRSGQPQIRQRARGWTGSRYRHLFYSDNDLVAHHEFGTGAQSPRGTVNARSSEGHQGYIIRPRDEDVLSFEWDKLGGARVAFEYVVHPGVEGKHFMRNALRDAAPDMKRRIARRIDNMEWDDF